MHEGFAVAGELLEDEALAAKQTGSELLVKVQANFGAPRGGQKPIFLHNEAGGHRAQVDGNDGAGIGCRKSHLAFAIAAAVGEVREK